MYLILRSIKLLIVFEYDQGRIQTNLDMSRLGDYELTYSISDISNNSDTLTRSIQIEDNIPPVVKLYGQHTMYVDLQSIIDKRAGFMTLVLMPLRTCIRKVKDFLIGIL